MPPLHSRQALKFAYMGEQVNYLSGSFGIAGQTLHPNALGSRVEAHRLGPAQDGIEDFFEDVEFFGLRGQSADRVFDGFDHRQQIRRRHDFRKLGEVETAGRSRLEADQILREEDLFSRLEVHLEEGLAVAVDARDDLFELRDREGDGFAVRRLEDFEFLFFLHPRLKTGALGNEIADLQDLLSFLIVGRKMAQGSPMMFTSHASSP